MATKAVDRRIEDLRASGHLEAPSSVELDQLTQLAAELLDVPTCLISLVDEKRQFFASSHGLGAPWCDLRETPLSHSFCQHTVASREVLRINDARLDSRVSQNLAITDLSVIAYLGFPILSLNGEFFGSFCVIDSKPREWSEKDCELLKKLTAVVASQLLSNEKISRTQTSLDLIIHDLKTPLTGIQLAAAMLNEKREGFDSSTLAIIDHLHAASESANRLIESLTSQDLKVENAERSELIEVIGDAIESLSHLAVEKKTSIDWKSIEQTIFVEAEQWIIERVLQNLLSNAIKFSPSGSRITLESFATKDEAGFEITDEGPGFSEDDRAKLFGRYAQLSAKPTGGESSTGLGLSIVKTLVDRSGGQIELLETEKGTTFQVTFRRIS